MDKRLLLIWLLSCLWLLGCSNSSNVVGEESPTQPAGTAVSQQVETPAPMLEVSATPAAATPTVIPDFSQAQVIPYDGPPLDRASAQDSFSGDGLAEPWRVRETAAGQVAISQKNSCGDECAGEIQLLFSESETGLPRLVRAGYVRQDVAFFEQDGEVVEVETISTEWWPTVSVEIEGWEEVGVLSGVVRLENGYAFSFWVRRR